MCDSFISCYIIVRHGYTPWNPIRLTEALGIFNAACAARTALLSTAASANAPHSVFEEVLISVIRPPVQPPGLTPEEIINWKDTVEDFSKFISFDISDPVDHAAMRQHL